MMEGPMEGVMYAPHSEPDKCITPMFSGIQLGEQPGYIHHPHNHPHPLHYPHPVGGGGAQHNGYHVAHPGMDPIKMEQDLMDIDSSSSGSYPGGGHMLPSQMQAMQGGAGGPGRARKNKEDKICGVCGDRALGYNFDAISCESCKAFFRRNAPKSLDYFKCPYDEKCKMDISNRRFCKRCRLKKCFEIGMRKEYILSEDEKARKRAKIESNSRAAPGMKNVQVPGQSNMRVVRDVDSKYGPMMTSQISLEVSSSYSNSPSRTLTPDESQEIDELVAAYQASLEIRMDHEVPRDNATGMGDLANIAEISVRRVIQMAKKVTAFKTLGREDQISLLKGGSIELLILRSVITYDKEKQHFLDPMDQEDVSAMNVDQLRQAENGTGLFEDHMKFVKCLAVDLEADLTTLILLLVIALFSPDRPNLNNKQLVSEEQEKYSMVLKNYIDSKYPESIARLQYPKLLMTLVDIRNLNEEHSQVLLKVNTDGIQPLMKEVLDITSAHKDIL